ncbi:hypothetical protein CPLU01_06704 [Colletotrichum plurivorum]|uniref:Uncharacterized protein n=1 Tax=Colletotrichum plurivorum TaxID=2175906 RepID=A0A8H6KHW3_9PEZI|nr:hypothetical protein CPLU01_06704 [Colletotrichum plurivorum]
MSAGSRLSPFALLPSHVFSRLFSPLPQHVRIGTRCNAAGGTRANERHNMVRRASWKQWKALTLFALFGDSPSGPAQPPKRLADAQLAPYGKTTAPRAALTANHPLPNQPPPPQARPQRAKIGCQDAATRAAHTVWVWDAEFKSSSQTNRRTSDAKGTTTTVFLSASTPRNPPRIQLLQPTALASLPELDGNESANTMWRHTAAEASTCSYSPSAHDDGLCDATLLLSLCICDLKGAGRLQKQHPLHASRNTTP